jgi:ATP-binding cassette, subfamily B, bacterial CvaB/MchF/RaxB
MAWTDAIRTQWGAKLPVVLQTEAAECGLACLAMVMGWHGVVTDLAVLRQRHAVSLKGMTLADLSRLAQKENMGARAVRLEINELAQLKLPAILHWELNHFVVLKSVGTQHITIHDPGVGIRRVNMAQVSEKFTGVAMELWPEPGFEPRKEATRISLSQLIGRVRGFLPSLTQVLMLSVMLEVLGLAGPLLMQWIVDHVVVARDANLLTTLAVGFGLVLVLQQVFGVARAWVMMSINTAINVQWQSSIFTHLLRLPVEYFQKRHLGDIVSRTNSIGEIQRVLTSAFAEALLDGAMMVLTLTMMFIYSPMLAWISILAIVLYMLVRVVWYRPMYLANQENIVRGAVLSTHYLETIRGVRAIKLFSRQPERQAAWQTLLVAQTNANLRIQKLDLFYHIVLLWVGTRQILDNQLSVGMLVAFLAYRAQFDTRMADLIAKFFDLKMLSLHAERLADVVLTQPEPMATSVAQSQAAQSQDLAIEIENLKFRYTDLDPWVLEGVSARIEPGQSVAIVGGSGCGKTTLAALLLGVYKPHEGSITVGGMPLERLGLAQWRGLLGTVMQDDTLFAGSVGENISFFDAQPDHDWIAQCAQLACLADDIDKMPMGYQTLVGDMGTVLSGGQKQRVLLARALYKRPRILLLDEATSHLDIQREARVNQAIAGLDMTRIIIAHRPETIGAAQRVLELESGKIVFDGVPADYFARMGIQRVGGL